LAGKSIPEITSFGSSDLEWDVKPNSINQSVGIIEQVNGAASLPLEIQWWLKKGGSVLLSVL